MIVVVVVVIVVVMVMTVVVIMMIIVPVLAILATHLVLFVLAHLVAEVFFALALTKLLARCVHVVIPALRYEVHRPSACVVLAAVPRPMPLVTGRYM